MTSSTSVSEWLLALAGPAVVLGAGASLLGGGSLPSSPAVRPVLEQLESGPPASTVLLGNSVTQASLDAELLGATSLAISGGQPAHWVAMVGRAEVLAPQRYVLYASPESLDGVAIDAGEDEEILMALAEPTDDELLERAVGASGAWRVLQMRRVAARRGVLELVAHTPVRLGFGQLTDQPVVEPALQKVFPAQGPVEKVEAISRGGRHDQRRPEEPPDAQALEASLLPLLIERVEEQGARLVVVLPPGKDAQPCGEGTPLHETRTWFAEQEVDLIDLSSWRVGAGMFDGDYHASLRGRQRISELLRARLEALPTDPAAPPSRHLCSG